MRRGWPAGRGAFANQGLTKAPPGALVSALTVIGLSIREGIRRRVFLAVLVLTIGFLGFYALGAHFAFRDVREFSAGGETRILDPKAFTGATIFGLAMFATLFLGAVLAVFLTLGAVRGDAETGLLQPLVVRPIGRTTMLLARFAGAAAISAAYVVVVYLAAAAITQATGNWGPDHLLGPALALALGVAIIAALSLLASTLLSVVAQGIVVFMVFGAGLTAGLLAQIPQADIVVFSKFGKLEATQKGLWAAFAAAVSAGRPLLTTVSPKHAQAWQAFAPAALRLEGEPAAIAQWWNMIRPGPR